MKIFWNNLTVSSVYTLTAVIIFSSCAPQHNTLTEAEKAAGWELLFDGQTLNGWRDYNGTGLTAPWTVEDGTLTALGKGDDSNGYIVTEKQYENFEFIFDWKIAEGGNSGVLYHVVERPQYKVPYVTGPEFQIIDDVNFPEKLEDWQSACADYAMHVADSAKKPKAAGQWNTSKIVFDNGHVEHWLNGEKVVEFEAWTDDWFARKGSGKWENAPEYGLAHKGLISLQDHGDRSWYRNLKIRELPRKPKEVSLFNGTDLTGWDVYGTEKWYVEDGLLICESGPDKGYGYLATREYYDDFELTADFKQDANGNSGIFFRSYVSEGVRVSGWQVEVAPPNNDSGGIYESYGRGWLVQIPDEKENVLKMGEWNTMRIAVKDDQVTTWLNDVLMVDLKDEKIGKAQGRIALQIHDGGGIKVSWKNLKLKQL
ncbi:MAG: DUF1080 domain-containing protein [Bacteroidales bacterium]|jgi:hypothetical protein|nr:DUF1080 domain-containing protein [Bacteroidales bacterium]